MKISSANVHPGRSCVTMGLETEYSHREQLFQLDWLSAQLTFTSCFLSILPQQPRTCVRSSHVRKQEVSEDPASAFACANPSSEKQDAKTHETRLLTVSATTPTNQPTNTSPIIDNISN